MSYQVIARKWRPQNFDQLVGQNHISTTLQNALKNGRLPHALLFTGPRGTGKTSSARILAKALRCPNAVNFVPCNTCRECEDIATGRSVDVMEIDGASNNGVDAIRELRDTVSYMPSSGKHKVYIIDEVHMLSTSAFNALLKTLEEPPEHVVFIMATTEVQKIPQTILSRCQRFDFRRIPTRQITDRLKLICEQEGVPFEEDALWAIARQGDGSMRDSQSLLDQVITFANGPLTRVSVVEILGLTDHALLFETLSALVTRDQAATLRILERVARAGYEPSLYAQDLMEHLRHLLLVKIGGDDALKMIELADSEIRSLQVLGQDLSEEEIHFLFDMAVKGAADVTRSAEPRIVLEMVLLRMSAAPRLVDLQTLLKSGLEAAPSAPARPTTPTAQKSATGAAPAPAKRAPSAGLNLTPQERWLELVTRMKDSDAFLAAKIEPLILRSLADKVVDLVIPPKMAFLKDQMTDPAVLNKIKSFVEQNWGPGYSVTVQLTHDQVAGTSASSMAQEKQKKKQDDLAQQIAEHPKVKTAAAVFKGQIKSIKESPTNGGSSK